MKSLLAFILLVSGCDFLPGLLPTTAPGDDHSEHLAVVWVSFDDDSPAAAPCTEAARRWADSEKPDLHDFGAHLARYFALQSQGRLRLVVTETPTRQLHEADFDRGGFLDVDRLTEAVRPRGFTGHLVVALRKTSLALYGGAAGITRAASHLVRYDWPGNIIPRKDLVRLTAHEMGHTLFRGTPLGGGHLLPLQSDRSMDSTDIAPPGIGFALMAGPGDRRGDDAMSAYERSLLGWITCREITRPGTYSLPDLVTRGGCLTLPDGPARLYLSYRARLSGIDRLEHDACTGSDHGLMDEGVLVMRVHHGRASLLTAKELVLSPRQEDYLGVLLPEGYAFAAGGLAVTVGPARGGVATLAVRPVAIRDSLPTNP